MAKDVIIKSTHRGLRYEDGRLTGVLEAGRYEIPEGRQGRLGGRRPVVEIVVVDMRGRGAAITAADARAAAQPGGVAYDQLMALYAARSPGTAHSAGSSPCWSAK